MERSLGRYSTYIYAVLRIVSGFLLLMHGTQKLFGYPPQNVAPGGSAPAGLSPMMTAAGVIETIGGLLIMFGLFAGIAAFIACGEMAAAYFIGHFSASKFLPIQNSGEPAVLLCFVFLFVASRGSGVWSIDSIFRSGPVSET